MAADIVVVGHESKQRYTVDYLLGERVWKSRQTAQAALGCFSLFFLFSLTCFIFFFCLDRHGRQLFLASS
jgi:hypothetical protein